MANSYGITPTFANLLLGTLQNVPVTVPIVCAQVHTGNPGPSGENAVSAVGVRQQMTVDTPNNGTTGLAGTPPSWTMTTGETIAAVSLWSGFQGDGDAVCMFTLAAAPPVTVAEGDLLILNVADIDFTGLAA